MKCKWSSKQHKRLPSQALLLRRQFRRFPGKNTPGGLWGTGEQHHTHAANQNGCDTSRGEYVFQTHFTHVLIEHSKGYKVSMCRRRSYQRKRLSKWEYAICIHCSLQASWKSWRSVWAKYDIVLLCIHDIQHTHFSLILLCFFRSRQMAPSSSSCNMCAK